MCNSEWLMQLCIRSNLLKSQGLGECYAGAASLKEWIDSYESTRFTPIAYRRAVITSEYDRVHARE